MTSLALARTEQHNPLPFSNWLHFHPLKVHGISSFHCWCHGICPSQRCNTAALRLMRQKWGEWGIDGSACEWVRRRRLPPDVTPKVMGNFPLIPFQTLQAQNKCCVSVRMADWFDAGAKQSINGSYTFWAVRWNYQMNPKNKNPKHTRKGEGVLWYFSWNQRLQTQSRPGLCHHQDNYIRDLNSALLALWLLLGSLWNHSHFVHHTGWITRICRRMTRWLSRTGVIKFYISWGQTLMQEYDVGSDILNLKLIFFFSAFGNGTFSTNHTGVIKFKDGEQI